jgi:aryl-alcohol dehydrogenase-like predicted oxidoreductase
VKALKECALHQPNRRRLGHSELMVTPVGLGCWQFSRGKGWNRYWPVLDERTIEGIVAASLDGGINWFDTAEAYGGGESERSLSRTLQKAGRRTGDVVIATKWMPLFRTAQNLGKTIDERIACLAPYPIDLYQVHHPAALSPNPAVIRAMAALVKTGRVRAIGVSNFGAKRMRAAHRLLREEGLELVSNQIHYSLLKRKAESNGVMEAARELGISIIAYSPLDQGVLTGRFHDDPAKVRAIAGPRKYRGFYRSKFLARSREVVEALKEIAGRHGATPAQVALSWLIGFHGETVVVIPGATRTTQAAENAAAMGIVLAGDELDHLDRVSRPFRG